MCGQFAFEVLAGRVHLKLLGIETGLALAAVGQ